MSLVIEGGGWWPPGQGEGPDWHYEECALHLSFDGDAIDVSIPGDGGGQKIGLVSVPVEAIARVLAEGAS